MEIINKIIKILTFLTLLALLGLSGYLVFLMANNGITKEYLITLIVCLMVAPAFGFLTYIDVRKYLSGE